jgi:hypothetical protein
VGGLSPNCGTHTVGGSQNLSECAWFIYYGCAILFKARRHFSGRPLGRTFLSSSNHSVQDVALYCRMRGKIGRKVDLGWGGDMLLVCLNNKCGQALVCTARR